MSGPQFEKLIASLFTKDGYKVSHCGGSGDEGIDLVLHFNGAKDVVQCKRWKSDIGSPVLRDFYGALMHANARHGFVITTASFSQNARLFAAGKPISLIEGKQLLLWLHGQYSAQQQTGETREKARAHAAPEKRSIEPHEVLGVRRGATTDEIRAAYHREMAKYHPDKVAHLGKDLQDLATSKAKEINNAYYLLTRK